MCKYGGGEQTSDAVSQLSKLGMPTFGARKIRRDCPMIRLPIKGASIIACIIEQNYTNSLRGIMITRFEVKNVRVFEGEGWNFDFRPLTILCGTNSSGKSTLLRSIMLLRQSQGIGEGYRTGNGKLRFIGTQVDFGNYQSLVSHNDVKRDMYLSLTVKGGMPKSDFDMLTGEEALANESEKEPTETYKKSAEEGSVPFQLKIDFTFCLSAGKSIADDAQEWEQSQGVLKKAAFTLTALGQELLTWHIENHSDPSSEKLAYAICIPAHFLKKVKYSEPFQKVLTTTEDDRFFTCDIGLDGLLPRSLAVQIADSEEMRGTWNLPLPPIIDQAIEIFRGHLSTIRYLSPLRSPAKRFYLAQLDVTPPADPAGEFLPYALRDIGKYKSFCLLPGQSDSPSRVDLALALNQWMFYIRTGQLPSDNSWENEIEYAKTKVLLEFKIRSSFQNEKHSLIDSGFGYSQILPIILRGLSASQGSILIVEQPELHLNPALQVRLAEFFVSMAKAGKQILIETHSEHIVNTVRVLSAEDESGQLAKITQITFIDAEDGYPMVHELSIQPDGTVPDWPPSFFGEATTLVGRLLRAQKRFIGQGKKS
jgi:predicted ATPase